VVNPLQGCFVRTHERKGRRILYGFYKLLKSSPDYFRVLQKLAGALGIFPLYAVQKA
jgi:uncharacterized membrane protein